MSQDPMGFDAGDSNLYRYVLNNATDRVDPSGFWSPGQSLMLGAGQVSQNQPSQPFSLYNTLGQKNPLDGSSYLDGNLKTNIPKSIDSLGSLSTWGNLITGPVAGNNYSGNNTAFGQVTGIADEFRITPRFGNPFELYNGQISIVEGYYKMGNWALVDFYQSNKSGSGSLAGNITPVDGYHGQVGYSGGQYYLGGGTTNPNGGWSGFGGIQGGKGNTTSYGGASYGSSFNLAGSGPINWSVSGSAWTSATKGFANSGASAIIGLHWGKVSLSLGIGLPAPGPDNAYRLYAPIGTDPAHPQYRGTQLGVPFSGSINIGF
jgi:hypothetical protein